MPMSVKERFRTAIEGGIPDRLPATTHHIIPYFLKKHLGGITNGQFFERFGLDQIVWIVRHKPADPQNECRDPLQKETGFLQAERFVSNSWQIGLLNQSGNSAGGIKRFSIKTPQGELTMSLQENEQTSWLTEHPIKNKHDIGLLQYMPVPHCDVEAVNNIAKHYGSEALIRGHICTFDIYGQPGCWQDACCLAGTQTMILAAHDDPKWVHEFLQILQARKLGFVRSLTGADYDILELGGGDASTTVISPKIFNEFVAPYDGSLIEAAHEAGQKIVYHTCGGMMPILEDIVSMKPDAVETLTPPSMGGDVDLGEAKRRIGGDVCLIGGFDQNRFLTSCDENETRSEVRRCFEQAGEGGGYIISPSDHFFDAEPRLLAAYADEAQKCIYT